MKRMFSADRTVFVQLQPVLVLNSILGRDVVARAALGHGTRHCDHDPIFLGGHVCNPVDG
jgi:hypothetical protein